RHERVQLARDAGLAVLEDAVAEAVAGAVGRLAPTGQGRGRPEAPVRLVTNIESLSALVADRIVVPGRQAVSMGVLAPGVGASTLAHDAAKPRIGQHVHP